MVLRERKSLCEYDFIRVGAVLVEWIDMENWLTLKGSQADLRTILNYFLFFFEL